MYAVFKTGGKQYRVQAGAKLKVETLPADVGSEVVIDQVLMVADGEKVSIGKPLIKGATVTAKVLSHGRADKVHIFKMRRRKHYQKHGAHRQNYSELFIAAISDGAGLSATATAPATVSTKADDLTQVEGIGPKIAEVLKQNGIATFAALAEQTPDKLRDLLKASGNQYNRAKPDTWPEQAALAAAGKWDELKKLTDALVGGIKK